MKRLVAAILVVVLMFTLGSALALRHTFVEFDAKKHGIGLFRYLTSCLPSFNELIEKDTYESILADVLFWLPDLSTDECIISRGINGATHKVVTINGLGEINFRPPVSLRIKYLMKTVFDSFLNDYEVSEPEVAAAASVAKEVSKDGKVTIYAAPSKSSTKLASAVSYYDCQILGTADVDGATWTRVNYVKEDVEGWILTK